MLNHISIMKYLVTKSKDELLLMYHLPTELYYNHHIYNINDIRKEIIIINNNEIEIIRIFIEMIDSELYKQVGWVVNETINQCMICKINFQILQRKHHCRTCGNIICDHINCMTKLYYVKDMIKYGIQIICQSCRPSNVSIVVK